MAARLFAVDDPSPHSGQRYVVNRSKDITGEDILRLVEGHIRTKADRVFYKDLSFVDDVVAAMPGNKSVVSSMRYSAETAWEVKCIYWGEQGEQKTGGIRYYCCYGRESEMEGGGSSQGLDLWVAASGPAPCGAA